MFRKTVFVLILSAAAAVAGAKNTEYAGLYSTPSGGGVRLALFPNGSYCLKTEGQAQSERGRYRIRAAAVRLDNGQFLIRSTEREAEEMGDDSHTYTPHFSHDSLCRFRYFCDRRTTTRSHSCDYCGIAR